MYCILKHDGSNVFSPHLFSGFVDIFSKSKDRLGAHASKILKFLHRNRIPSSAIPFPVLEGYNSICTMRSTVVQDFLEFLLQKEKGKCRKEAGFDHHPIQPSGSNHRMIDVVTFLLFT